MALTFAWSSFPKREKEKEKEEMRTRSRSKEKEEEEELKLSVESSSEESGSESDSEVESDDDDLKKELSSSLRFQSGKGGSDEGSDEDNDEDDSDEDSDDDSEGDEGSEDEDEDADEAFFAKKMQLIEKSKKRKRKEKEESVWVDEDDVSEQKWDISNKKIKKARKAEDTRTIDAQSFNERLRERYSSMQRADVSWAKTPEKKKVRKGDDEDEDSDSDDDDLLRTTARVIERGGKKKEIGSGRISLVRVGNANAAQPSHSIISALAFHPNQQIMLTAGMDKTLNLFHIDGQRNPKVQGVYVKDLPITSSFFCRGGKEVLMTGKRPFFYYFDLESGRTERINSIRGRAERSLKHAIISPDDKCIAIQGIQGSILVLCGISKQLLFTLQINGEVKAMSFSHDSTILYATGVGGEVYEWDLRRRRCIERWTDEGSAAVSSLAISQNYLACGSTAGVVNLYKGPFQKGGKVRATRTPSKTFMNLRTEISGCAINKQEELMAVWSLRKMNAIRMVHLPTMTVFSNFPAPVPPLGHPSKCAFSPNSGYFALGNDFGKVLLYRIPHYSSS